MTRTISLLVVCACLACGGGTTGTSPSDGLKFSGFAERADGSRADSLSMTVRSGTSDSTLVESGTDAEGEFSMDLPSAEQALVIDVSGVGSTTLARSQSGDGAMAAKLNVTSQGALTATQISETQIEQSSLCQSLRVSGNTLVVVGAVGQDPCPVTVLVSSEELRLQSFSASLFATCGGTRSLVATSGIASDGRATLNLSQTLSDGCTEISIAVTSSEAPGLETVFSVL